MKKKIIAITSAVFVCLFLLTVIGFGLWQYYSSNAVKTGNKLNVSWYNEEDKEFVLTTADELYELAALSDYYNFKGQTIKLGADIVINEGNAEDWAENAPARKWAPISGFTGTFDGQGHTISGLYAKGFDAHMALFCDVASSAVIQDFKLVNSYYVADGYGSVSAISSGGGGNFKRIYCDAIIQCSGENAGGIIGKLNLNATLEECWFAGKIVTQERSAGGIIGSIMGAQVKMEHCLFSGDIDQQYTEAGARTGGLVGRVNEEGAGLEMNDCLASGSLKSGNIYYTGSVLGVSYAKTSLEAINTYGSFGTFDTAIGRSGESGIISAFPLGVAEKELIGENAYRWTNLDFDKYWTIVKEDTPILQCFADEVVSVAGIERAFDLSWYDATKKEYVLSDLDDLYGFYMVSASTDFKGKTVKLGADIVVNEGKASEWAKDAANAPANLWYPIQKFSGTFDGQGHSISGLYLSTAMQMSGLFRQTTLEAAIKNVSVKNSCFVHTSTGNAMMGSIVGRGGGTFENIYSDAIMVSSGSLVGGIIGQINLDGDNKISNCWFNGAISMKENTGRYVGGMAGNVVKGKTVIEHCLNSGDISLEIVGAGVFAGGMTGNAANTKTYLTIDDCLNVGKITTAHDICVGAIIGRIPKGPIVTISNTYATSESYQHPTSGFMGVGNQSSTWTGNVVQYAQEKISGYGGYQWTTLDFANYWAVQTKSTPILKQFASSVPSLAGVKKMVDISWYKADAKEMTINTVEQLYGFYIASGIETFKDKTVKLGKDIVVNGGNAADWATTAPKNTWLPIQKFAGTFDGQGHTISGIYSNTNASYVGLFGQTVQGSTIKNLSLKNSYFNNSTTSMAAMGSIAGQMGGTLDTVYSDAILTSTGTQVGGLVGRVNQSSAAKYVINNCWFDGSVSVTSEDVVKGKYAGGIVGALVQGTLDITNTLNSGEVSYVYKNITLNSEGKKQFPAVYVGGLCGGVMNGNTFNKDGSIKRVGELRLSGCLNEGNVEVIAGGETHLYGLGSIFGYTADKAVVTMNDIYNVAGTCVRLHHYNSKTTKVTGGVVSLPQSQLAGTNGYKYTTLNFTKYWVARTDEVPALKSFAAGTIDVANEMRMNISWLNKSAGTENDPYIITNAADLYGLSILVSSGNTFKGKYIKISDATDKIVVNEGKATDWAEGKNLPANEWIPIGTCTNLDAKEGNTFQGTFDGNGKTISGLYAKDYPSTTGLFGYTMNSTIQNFRLENSYLSSESSAMGSIIGYGEGTLKDIYSDAILDTENQTVGGLIGRVQDKSSSSKTGNDLTVCTIENCWFNGKIDVDYAGRMYTGGLVGFVIYGTVNMKNCLYTGTIDATYTGTKTSIDLNVGGMVAKDNAGVEIVISDSMSAGEINITAANGTEIKSVGSIAGAIGKKLNVSSNVYATTDCYDVEAGSVKNQEGSVTKLSEDNFWGIKGYQMTALNFTQYWSARTDKVPALKKFAGNGITIPANTWRFDDSWYNEEQTVFELENVGQFYGFASLVNSDKTFRGKTVTLKNDMIITDSDWTPIGTSAANSFQGVFDGNDKTISGINVTMNDSDNYIGLFGWTADASIKNFTLSNSKFTGTASAMGAIIGNGDGALANIRCDSSVLLETTSTTTVGGMIGRVQDPLQTTNANRIANTLLSVTNCWFEGSIKQTNNIKDGTTIIGGMVGYLIHGTAIVDNCLFTGTLDCAKTNGTSKHLYVGGIFGKANGTSITNYEIKHCLSAGSEIKATVTGCKKYVGAITGQVQGNETFDKVYATSECCATAVGTGTAPTTPVSASTLYGELGDSNTDLDFTTYWVTRSDKVPALKYFVNRDTIEGKVLWLFESTGAQADPYVLANETEFTVFATLVNSGYSFENKMVMLKDNITVTATSWTPIGTTEANAFCGTFDGNGKTISGINVAWNNSKTYAGLFGNVSDATIKNFTLSNSRFSGTASAMGSIIGNGDGTMENVRCAETVVIETTTTAIIGGMIARVQDPLGTKNTYVNVTSLTVRGCWFEGSIEQTISTNTSTQTGGIVGYIVHGVTMVDNCLFTGSMDCEKTTGTSKHLYVGGIIGRQNGGTNSRFTMSNCLSAGKEIKTTINGCKEYVGALFSQNVSAETYSNVYATSECCAQAVGSGTQPTTPVSASTLYGELGDTNTELDFTNYWVARNGKVPALKYFVEKEGN